MTVPAEEIQMRTQMIVFGVHTLPVGWR
ncbi:hypothetical protein M2275_008477 [Rhodococcus opacus]|nr:hypothetical protein [Rhodococcus opacus]MDH6293531.1 hypothetical protein [Rhodococcus opacus]